MFGDAKGRLDDAGTTLKGDRSRLDDAKRRQEATEKPQYSSTDPPPLKLREGRFSRILTNSRGLNADFADGADWLRS